MSTFRKLSKFLPDELYLKLMYRHIVGKRLDLKNPQTFNEKLQWLKLHDRKPIYTTMVDKYSAKQYVADIIGDQYIIPTLGIWDTFDEIDFDSLPDRFVLKCTHDSGGVCICRDRDRFNVEEAREKINRALHRNFYYVFREWPYKNVQPRIIAEKYMEDPSIKELRDYKIYTINGKAVMCMINQDRGKHTRADYFDKDFNWLDFTWGYDHADNRPERPQNYEKMFELAEKLAVGTIELRVDFYQVGEEIYFGELTFFDGGGFDKIEPIEWDYELGRMLVLSKG